MITGCEMLGVLGLRRCTFCHQGEKELKLKAKKRAATWSLMLNTSQPCYRTFADFSSSSSSLIKKKKSKLCRQLHPPAKQALPSIASTSVSHCSISHRHEDGVTGSSPDHTLRGLKEPSTRGFVLLRDDKARGEAGIQWKWIPNNR